MLALQILCIVFMSIMLYMPGPLLTSICKDTGWTMGQAGLLNSVVYIMMAIFAVVGGVIMAKLGSKKTMLCALILGAVGCFIAQIAGTSLYVHLAARVISGIGFGLYFVVPATVISYWFSKEKAVFFQGVRCTADLFSCSLPYYIILPIFAICSRWQTTFAVVGIPLIILFVIYLFFARETDDEKVERAQSAESKTSMFNGLGLVIRNPNCWFIILGELGKVFAYNMFLTYLPAYLELNKGMTPAAASSYTGIISIVGMLSGAIMGGVSAAIGYRKILTWPMLLMTAFGALGALFTTGPLLMLFCALMGFGVTGFMVAYTAIPYELPGLTPAAASCSVALTLCIPYIFSSFGPLIYDALSGAGLSMKTILLIFLIPGFVFSIPCFFLLETGPKGKYAQSLSALNPKA